MLTDVIPAKYRKAVYAAYAVAATIVGALTIASVNVGKAPDVLAYLGIAVGAVAASNTAPVDKGEDGTVNASGVLVTVLVVLAILWLLGIRFHVGG